MRRRSLLISTLLLSLSVTSLLAAEPGACRWSFDTVKGQSLPEGWQFVGGSWTPKALIRPQGNTNAVAAVASDHHVAFPSICKTRKGTLLIVYREAFTHASGKPDDGRVMLVRSTDGGKTWGRPELVVDDPKNDDRNAAVSCMDDGALCVIWDKYLHGKHHWAWLATSTDDGRSWSKPVKASVTENVHTRSPAIDLSNGKWLVPYSESNNSPTASCFFSIYDPKTRAFEEIAATPRGQRNLADETAVVRAADGKLVALIRSNVDPELFQITSRDDGRTWSKAKMIGIPSQFTPADLIRLENGYLAAAFSFRERRDERLVVSRDHGKTWDVENSVEVFDATPSIGGDRSYPASVQVDKDTIGTVLYETKQHPTGGRIWFVTTKIAALDAPRVNTLYQGDKQAEAAFALWPKACLGKNASVTYRFTGRLGKAPNVVGLVMDFQDAKNYTALTYQMGVGPGRKGATNHVQLVRAIDGKLTRLKDQGAKGDLFNDGNLHVLGVHQADGKWVFTIDGHEQFPVEENVGRPRGILVRRAAVAVYDVELRDATVRANLKRPLSQLTPR